MSFVRLNFSLFVGDIFKKKISIFLYVCGKRYLFLNGHSNHLLCNAVDFGPEVSCLHVILDGTNVSCLLSLGKSQVY